MQTPSLLQGHHNYDILLSAMTSEVWHHDLSYDIIQLEHHNYDTMLSVMT